MTSSRPLRIALVSTLFAAVLATSNNLTFGQQTAARPDRGAMPGAAYSVSDLESVSLTNGNMNLSIPLASLPPMAGGKLGLTLNAVYNSKLWNVTRTEYQSLLQQGCQSWVVSTPQVSEVGGWRIAGGEYQIVFRDAAEDFSYVVPPSAPPGSCESDVAEYNRLLYQWKRVVLIGPDGAEHELRPVDNYQPYGPTGGSRPYLFNYYKDTPYSINAPMRYYSFDGSFLWAVINPSGPTLWSVYLKDGTKIVQTSNGIQRITDTNGNSIKMFSDLDGYGNPVRHYQDEQTGREIKYTDDPTGNNGGRQIRVQYQTVNGAWQTTSINWGITTVRGKLYRVEDWTPLGGESGGGVHCYYDVELGTDLAVIREIVFPVTEPGVAPRQFSFEYNSDETESATNQAVWACSMAPQSYTRTASKGMGGLSQITTPTGAIVNYAYSRNNEHNFTLFSETDRIAKETVTQKQITHDGTTETWTYAIDEIAGNGGSVTGPDGSTTGESSYSHNPALSMYFGPNNGKAGLVFRSTQSNKVRVERHWTTLLFDGGNPGVAGSVGQVQTFNPVVDAEYTTLLDDTPSHNPVKMSAKTFQYDYNGNLLSTTEYDWFDPALVTYGSDAVPTGVPAGATVLRTTSNTFHNPATTSNSANVYAKRSLSSATPLILNAPQQTTTGPAIAQFSYDGNSYGTAPTVGNLTSKRIWFDLESRWITTSSTYGLYGNIATVTDARGKVTQLFYDDATHALPNRVVVDPQNGTGTQTITTAFDYYTGLVTSQADANNRISTIDYTNQLLGTFDPFGRPGVTIGPLVNAGGVNQHHRVTTTYFDSTRQAIVAADLNTENDKLLKTRTTADMLGRPVLTEQTEDGANFTISAQKVYDLAHNVTYSSNPRRSASAPTDGWTRATNDPLGRTVEVATFSGTTQPPLSGTNGNWTGSVTSAYSANEVTVTDQAGKQRKSVSNALGQLTSVFEDPAGLNYQTTYDYDLLGNLRHVYQGAQTRTFTYDSLSQLRSAVNPESGTITYAYDDNGNLLTKTDARSVTATYAYDALNRAVTRSYSDGTPTVTYVYDSGSISNGKGRLASVSNSVSGYSYSGYDATGKVLGSSQSISGQNYSMAYSYGLAGHVTSMTYPSGRVASYNYDNAGRLADKDATHLAFTGNLGDGTTRTYAKGISYGAAGQMTQEQFGTTTAVFNKRFHNSRGQLAEILAATTGNDTSWNRGKMVNDYSLQCSGAGCNATDNNGNLRKQTVFIPNNEQNTSSTSRYQQYDYDSLNRLQRVHEYTGNTSLDWQQEYLYDRWGNRLIDTNINKSWGGGINNKSFTVSVTNNRLAVPSGQSGTMTYDSAGNMTTDTYSGAGVTRVYDAENRMTQETTYNSVVSGVYSYDGDGRRVKRLVGGVQTWQVYGLAGELLAEYAANGAPASPQKEYGYRNGELLITAEAGSATANSISLNGSTGYVQVPNSTSLNITGAITLEAWIKPSSAGANQDIVARESWAQSGTGGGYELSLYLGKVRLDFYQTPTTYTTALGATVLSAGSWHHVVGLSDGSQMRVYVDGVLDGTTASSSAPGSGTSSLKIGRHSLGSYFNGLIDEVRVSNAALYTANFTPTASLTASGNTKGLWKFDGQTPNDSSGNANHGTLNGGAAYSADVPSGGGGGGGPQNVSWTGAVGVTVSGNNLTKTAANGWGNSGAASNQTLVSGDGYVEFTPSETWSNRMIGLSHGNTDQGYADIDFAIFLGGTAFYVYEGGNSPGYFGTYTTNDTFRVAVEGGVVKYKKNGTVFYTSTLTPTYPLLADTSLYHTEGTLSNVVISGNLSGGGGGGASSAQIKWLVTDQLGTPRMIFDQSGSLANVSRHDYLPFGEELFSGTGGRATAQGYGGDNVRQKFTSKERDNETGLDYFEARYYSSTQGRFINPDPIMISDQQTGNPQLWNLYNYVGNNPLKFTDPTGMKLVRLGQHTDAWIDNRDKEINQQLNDPNSNLTSKQREGILDELDTIRLEKQGNMMAREALSLLRNLGGGEDANLTVSDFTLSTDPAHDFMSDPKFVRGAGGVEKARKESAEMATGAEMFVLTNYSTQIFINTSSSATVGKAFGLGNPYSGDVLSDITVMASTAMVHERTHRDGRSKEGRSEGAAYKEQTRVLWKFGPDAFKSKNNYARWSLQYLSKAAKETATGK